MSNEMATRAGTVKLGERRPEQAPSVERLERQALGGIGKKTLLMTGFAGEDAEGARFSQG